MYVSLLHYAVVRDGGCGSGKGWLPFSFIARAAITLAICTEIEPDIAVGHSVDQVISA